MTTETTQATALLGGEFLIRNSNPEQVFIPEDFTDEQKLIAQTCSDFLEQEIWPHLDLIDSHADENLVPQLLEKAGQLGLLGTSVPEEYGGFGLDFISTMLVTEVLGGGHAFAVSVGAHTGIGTLPILYYGTEAQKQYYLPKLATGAWKAAYCLTEPDAGSDANSGKARAKLSADGKHYLLTGQKMWISNAGFADVFTVFAKIEENGQPDKNLTAFIVERHFEGISFGPEEHKMGIKGSSTRQIFFTNCPVPVENMLSTRENGFRIAVNILNIGRIKLAAAAIGSAKLVAKQSVAYAAERKQFGQSIGSFGAIQHKLAEQHIRIWIAESATYRAARAIEDAISSLQAQGIDQATAKLKGVEQYAIECALLKVLASECLNYVTDEGVQIYGGMGYSADAPMERSYRDSRINRIFEGTNEINRMLAIGTLLKRGLKGELNLFQPALAVAKELATIPDFSEPEGVLAVEKQTVSRFKKVLLLVAGAAVQKLGPALDAQQEIVMNLADILIEIYAAESGLLRAEKLLILHGEKAAQMPVLVLRTWLNDAAGRIQFSAQTAVNAFAEADDQRMLLLGIKRFCKQAPFNTIAARRQIAAGLNG